MASCCSSEPFSLRIEVFGSGLSLCLRVVSAMTTVPGSAMACSRSTRVWSALVRSVITGRTQLYGVLGHPVVHSRSPEMQNAAFDDLGLTVGGDVTAAFKASAVHPIPRHERRPE